MHIYVIKRPDGLVKIGRSKQPTLRLAAIQNQGGFASEAAWVSIPVDDSCDVERRAHASLKICRTIGEWFDVPFDNAVASVVFEIGIKSSNDVNNSAAMRLKESIKDAGFTHAQLAEKIGISRASITQWTSGSTKSLKPVNLFAAADTLKVSARWLATGDTSESEIESILRNLSLEHRAQAVRMLSAFAASVRGMH